MFMVCVCVCEGRSERRWPLVTADWTGALFPFSLCVCIYKMYARQLTGSGLWPPVLFIVPASMAEAG